MANSAAARSRRRVDVGADIGIGLMATSSEVRGDDAADQRRIAAVRRGYRRTAR
jgi:hypothetical protein